eukprot:CAMPEP_0173391692 /NCGR_PEP_ID=MMETSP1356-20130122/18533_1 /TAXON_ID=77927 ORGANISM="Hemiselmis virescens, Strain PCC157" /NCGR_SAMPLE_ID=MMETSP1356 /ASSEMBLY_ACC=CAM_ASM_000847 /LENGTH=114 /DNA_ID=CAMNT_0014349365 /DNA_START=38 /DNA_END=382 /DNA_ORIENTATION=-
MGKSSLMVALAASLVGAIATVLLLSTESGFAPAPRGWGGEAAVRQGRVELDSFDDPVSRGVYAPFRVQIKTDPSQRFVDNHVLPGEMYSRPSGLRGEQRRGGVQLANRKRTQGI